MNLLLAIATTTILAAPQQAAAPVAPPAPPAPAQTPSPDANVQFILTATSTDGSRGVVASTEVTDGKDSHIWSEPALCGVGAGNRTVFGADVIAWRVAGQIVQRDGSTYTVRFEWTRVGGGAETPGTNSPRTVIVRPGEHVQLERVPATGTSACAGELKLEATIGSKMLAPNIFRPVSVAAGGRGIGGGARGGGGGAGRAGGGGAAATMGSGSGSGGGAGVGVSGSGSAGGGSGSTAVGAAPAGGRGRGAGGGGRAGGGGALAGTTDAQREAMLQASAARLEAVRLGAANPPLDAELWLVHRLPDGTEEVQQLKQRVGDEYTFKPVTVAISGSNVTVEVTGAVYQRYKASGPDGLSVLIRRRIKGNGTNPFDLAGSSTSTIVVPPAGEVVSFPLPDPVRGESPTDRTAGVSLQARGNVRLDGHRFEVRLRVSPGK